MSETVLLIVSSGDKLEIAGGKTVPIGTYLNETVVPTMALIEAGYEVVLASPTGKRPVMDPHSDDASHFGGDVAAYQAARDFWENSPTMRSARTLADVVAGGLDLYAGLFVPGGHAPIVDLADSPELGEILRHFHIRAKPTALLCHGPIAIVSAMPNAKAFIGAMEAGDLVTARQVARGWPYAGYDMTIFSNPEEKWIEDNQMGGPMKWHVVDALEAAGGNVKASAEIFAPLVVEDRELITGQNPHSDHGVAEALVRALARSAATAAA